jgi:hypothetical protein
MKVQVATLVLSESSFMQFKVHIHDDLREQWLAASKDLKVELRDAISRHLKRRFDGVAPSFFFVMEDRTKGGEPTRPHGHGSIEVRRNAVPRRGKGSRGLAQLAATDLKAAELAAGEHKIVLALKAASGGLDPRFAVTSGLDQCRNVWHRKPYGMFFNSPWVDYACG